TDREEEAERSAAETGNEGDPRQSEKREQEAQIVGMKGCDIDGPLALSAVNYGDAIQHSTMAEPVNHGAEPVSEIIVDADTGHDTYPYGGKAQDECHRLAREQDHDEHDDERAGKIEADR